MEERLKEVISKDERALLNQDLILIDLYERYFRLLFSLKEKLGRPDSDIDELIKKEPEGEKKQRLKESLISYEIVMVKSLSECAINLYHFNFSKEILKYVLRFGLRKSPKLQEIVADTITFFMMSDNPSTYILKLLILEHFGKLFKQRKFVAMTPDLVFGSLCDIYCEGSDAVSREQKDMDTLDQRINAMRDRKKRNKLSKSGEKLLKQLEQDRTRRNERRKRKGLDDPRLQKELKQQLAASEATIDPQKINKMVNQLVEKYYYLMFKIIRDFPDSRLFTMAIDGILALAHKIEAKLLVSIVSAMQDSQETMKEMMHEIAEKESKNNKHFMNHPGFVALMKKRLATVFSAIEITSKSAYLEEMEEKVSLTCLYVLLQDILRFKFPLHHFEPVRRVKFISLLEKLFLARKHLFADCLAAYLKLLMGILCDQLESPSDPFFAKTVCTFVYLAVHVSFKVSSLEVHQAEVVDG